MTTEYEPITPYQEIAPDQSPFVRGIRATYYLLNTQYNFGLREAVRIVRLAQQYETAPQEPSTKGNNAENEALTIFDESFALPYEETPSTVPLLAYVRRKIYGAVDRVGEGVTRWFMQASYYSVYSEFAISPEEEKDIRDTE